MVKCLKIGNVVYQNIALYSYDAENGAKVLIDPLLNDFKSFKNAVIDTLNWLIKESTKKIIDGEFNEQLVSTAVKRVERYSGLIEQTQNSLTKEDLIKVLESL